MTTPAAVTVPAAPPGAGRPGAAPALLIDSVPGLVSALENERSSGRSVGLVPTMGALHDGHRALIGRAAAECDVVVVSVFVNPTQFGDPADLDAYPRTLPSDLATAASAGASIVFAPTVGEMYPAGPGGPHTVVSLPDLAGRLEGASRPGHFDGVATVVVKLLAMAGRCRAYFGEKDFQQLTLVRRVVADLSLPADIVGCETVRDADGLALSSRNAHLSPVERRAALALPRALRTGAGLIAGGEARTEMVERAMAEVVATEAAATEATVALDYAVVVRARDLEHVATTGGDEPLRLLVAATVGGVRLIDNLDPRRGR